MKRFYLGVPTALLIAFTFVFVNWSTDFKMRQKAEEAAIQAAAIEDAQVKRLYQEEMQRKAREASEARAQELAEKKRRDELEEQQWIELNQRLDTALQERGALTEKIYETTNLLYLEQERHLRVTDSLERRKSAEKFLAEYVPKAESNRNHILKLLAKAERLKSARELALTSQSTTKR